MRARFRRLAILATLMVGAACNDSNPPFEPADPDTHGSPSTTKAIATLSWNQLARELVAQYKPSAHVQFRLHAYLALAQYNSVIAAEQSRGRAPHPSVGAAVAGASVEVLSYIFPADTAIIAARLRTQKEAEKQGAPGHTRRDFAAGEAIGRQVGAAVVERASADRFNPPWTGAVPVCDGCWYSSANPPAPPALPLLGQMRPFFLESGDQFRPPPPPAFGSAEFQAGLVEVRQVSDTRTEAQKQIAIFWASNTGSYWNEVASELIAKYRLDERRASHVLALTHMAAMDALIASHEAKYTYWLIRPSQADPGIVLPIGLPNFPAYPSNHTAASGTAAGILARFFPAQRQRLLTMGDEASMSRLYGGIHYRFDLDGGKHIAKHLIPLALSKDVHGHRPFPF
jgi:hypothetical protein